MPYGITLCTSQYCTVYSTVGCICNSFVSTEDRGETRKAKQETGGDRREKGERSAKGERRAGGEC